MKLVGSAPAGRLPAGSKGFFDTDFRTYAAPAGLAADAVVAIVPPRLSGKLNVTDAVNVFSLPPFPVPPVADSAVDDNVPPATSSPPSLPPWRPIACMSCSLPLRRPKCRWKAGLVFFTRYMRRSFGCMRMLRTIVSAVSAPPRTSATLWCTRISRTAAATLGAPSNAFSSCPISVWRLRRERTRSAGNLATFAVALVLVASALSDANSGLTAAPGVGVSTGSPNPMALSRARPPA